ncbi:lipid A biosynthesis acyltransferase [Actinobacteria bacterium OK074]|nr:lipid A biosynthesis acyltransferase [Actinobacteria bacterium OK074]
MRGTSLAAAARRLIALGPDAFAGPRTDAFVAEVGGRHPGRALFKRVSAEAIARTGLPGVCPSKTAEQVYENFIWTQFVCKTLMAAAPDVSVEFARTRFGIAAAERALADGVPAILSAFHYTGYPLVALGLAKSSIAPLLSKAREDILDRSIDDPRDAVRMSSRSAAVRLTQELRGGRSVWVMVDVVLPSVRVMATRFLGHSLLVGAGMGKIAQLAGRPCVPLCWGPADQGLSVCVESAIDPAGRSEEAFLQDFVNTQAPFVARQPEHWLEWYALLPDAPKLRAAMKKGNDELWEQLTPALD